MTNNIILIEDELVKNFYPITLTKPTVTLQFGSTNILENLNKDFCSIWYLVFCI